MSETDINSRLYWDRRFESDWEECGGPAQTRWFAKLALGNLEPSIADDIRDSGLSICDWGCALADAVEVLAASFPRSEVSGVDVSPVAVRRAREAVSSCAFYVAESPRRLGRRFEVVFSSNTLEHVARPVELMRELAAIVDRYLIVLVPFDEYPRIEEHFHTFTHRSFPPALGELRMVDFRVIDTRSIDRTAWEGSQMLVVYAHRELALELPLLDTGYGHDLRWTERLGDEDLRALIAEGERLRWALAQRSVQLGTDVSRLETGNSDLRSERETLQSGLLESERQIADLRTERETLQSGLLESERQIADLTTDRETLQSGLLESERQIADLQVVRDRYLGELNAIHGNRLWKLVSGYDRMMSRVPGARPYELARKVRRLVKGSRAIPSPETRPSRVEPDLMRLLKERRESAFFVFPPIIDWNIPLFQRPHHIARCLARQGYLYLFCTPNHAYDRIHGLEEVIPNCFITDQFEQLENVELDTDGRKVVHLYSTDNMRDASWADHQLALGHTVLYEYVDEIHPGISGKPIPRLTYERHERILADERCYVAATATRLHEEVLRHRRANCALITNGVDYDHFATAERLLGAPAELEPVLAKGRPIVGYYGALASWLDYDLVRHLATQRPGVEIVFIGLDYDRSVGRSGIAEMDNVTVLQPVPYSILPRYAVWFDVCTIPFSLNEITLSTSPIKLFEYMALRKPIVTTALPECRKYESVLVADEREDFVEAMDRALDLGSDRDYLALLEREARANTWARKADDLLQLLRPALEG